MTSRLASKIVGYAHRVAEVHLRDPRQRVALLDRVVEDVRRGIRRLERRGVDVGDALDVAGHQHGLLHRLGGRRAALQRHLAAGVADVEVVDARVVLLDRGPDLRRRVVVGVEELLAHVAGEVEQSHHALLSVVSRARRAGPEDGPRGRGASVPHRPGRAAATLPWVARPVPARATTMSSTRDLAIRTVAWGIVGNAALALLKGVAGTARELVRARGRRYRVGDRRVHLGAAAVRAALRDAARRRQPPLRARPRRAPADLRGRRVPARGGGRHLDRGRSGASATPQATPEPWTLLVVGAVIVGKEWAYRVVSRRGDATRSSALRADAWHHRSDALTSLAAFVGISVALVMGEGWESADAWAALAAAAVITVNAYLVFPPGARRADGRAAPRRARRRHPAHRRGRRRRRRHREVLRQEDRHGPPRRPAPRRRRLDQRARGARDRAPAEDAS